MDGLGRTEQFAGLHLHFEKQLGQREIARALELGQSTVHDMLDRFKNSGLPWPITPALAPSQLEKFENKIKGTFWIDSVRISR